MTDRKWADLTEWIAWLCVADSPNLPAALWLISTSMPDKHIQSEGADWRLETEMAASFANLIGLCPDVNAKGRERPAGGSGTWRGMADMVNHFLHQYPGHSRFLLLMFCAIGKELEKDYEPAEPGTAELEALLGELDRRLPHLLPGVLEMMADHPAAGALAVRWRPPEKSQQELIVRKLLIFLRELNHLLREGGGPQGQLWKAVAELFLEDPALVAKLDPDPPAPPLETLIEVEGIIDDACMALPGKVLRICQLLTTKPVCN